MNEVRLKRYKLQTYNYKQLVAQHSFGFWLGACQYFEIGHVNIIPTMQFISGICGNTEAKLYMLSLSVSGISKIIHCGIPINTPYWLVGYISHTTVAV